MPFDRSSHQRVAGIDVLRGLAVLFVVIDHVQLRFVIENQPVGGVLPDVIERVLFRSGYQSVLAFFVISGFLITSLSLQRWGSLERTPITTFYRLRAARILPCLLLLLAILTVLHLVGAWGFTINPERSTLPRALLAALTFHINWLEGHHGYLPGSWDVLWSLAVEEVFYIVFPVACVLLRREGWVLLGLLALLVIGPFNRAALAGQDPWQDYAYLSCADALAYGCLAAWISTRMQLSRTVLRALLCVGLSAVLLVGVIRTLPLGVALMLMALTGGVGNGVLSRGTGWLRLIGRCSYEIYLTHMFVVMTLVRVLKAGYGTFAVMVALSVLLGYLVARLFSEPMNALLRGAQTSAAPSLRDRIRPKG